MAVTYIRRVAGIDGGKAGASGGGVASGAFFQSKCRRCETRQLIDVTYSRIQIDVAGPTCQECERAAFDVAKEPSSGRPAGVDRPERIVKVWLASRDRAAPRVEVRDIPVGGQIAKRVEVLPAARVDLSRVVTDRESLPAAEQRGRWATEVAAKLGTGTWQAVAPAWQEKHCDILAALAGALDEAWVILRASGSLVGRVVVRLQGLPEIVNVLVAEVVARSAAAQPEPPRRTLADRLRQVGVAVCAATDSHGCASFGATLAQFGIPADLEQLAAAVDQELVQRLIDDLNLPVFWAERTMPTLEDMFRLMVMPVAVAPAPPEPASRPMPAGHLDATRERIRETRRVDTVTRPLMFGDAGG